MQKLRQRAQAWAVKLRVNPRVSRVLATHGKWGSCSALETVKLTVDSAPQAARFQDDVIVHELLHLHLRLHLHLHLHLHPATVASPGRS